MVLDLSRIQADLAGDAIGADAHLYPSVDSTNRVIRDLATLGHGTLVMAEHQTAGRGRHARKWYAPPETSLHMSLALGWPPELQTTRAVMLAALSVSDAITQVTGLHPTIKWPNDVLLSGKKVCGILAESLSSASPPLIVLGIGINVNFDPAREADVPDTAGSLMLETGAEVCRHDLLTAVIQCVRMWYRCVKEDSVRIYEAWSSRLGISGQSVQVTESSGSWEGTALGVNLDGALQVQAADGARHTLYAGDVSIRS
ncbi:MAG: biotin--[acetyl-CoA-carboxylase] ligase [Chloroflexota bacterium]